MATEENYANSDLNAESEKVNIKQVFYDYVIRYWYLYILTLMLSLMIGYYYAWYSTPVYSARATVLLKLANPGAQKGDIISAMNEFDDDRNLQNEIEVIKSRTMVARTVKALNFDISYYYVGNVKTREVYLECPFKVINDSIKLKALNDPIEIHIISDKKFRLTFTNSKTKESFSNIYSFDEQIHNELGSYRLVKRGFFNARAYNNPRYDKRNYLVRVQNMESVVERYQSLLTVSVLTKASSILNIYIEDKVPTKAVDFIDKLIEIWMQSSIDQKNELATNSLKFIDEQILLISQDLNSVEKEFEDFRAQKGITDLNIEAQGFVNSAREYDVRLSEIDLKLSFLQYLQSYVEDDKNISGMSPASIGIDDALLLKLISQLNDLESQREIMRAGATEENPRIQEFNLAIQNTKNDLIENIRSIVAGLTASKAEARSQLNRVEGHIVTLPGTDRVIVNIKRQMEVKANLYTYLMQKRAETAIILAGTTSDNRAIDRAAASFNPIRPVKSEIYLISVFMGLILPAAFVYFKNMLNDKIMDRSDIEKQTKLPVIGMVGMSESSNEFVIQENSKSFIAEAFRSIRTNLQFFIRNQNKAKTFLVTSSISGEGKSFCSLNLAAIFALSGKKTILVGFDLRKPKSMSHLGLKGELGVTNYLIGSSTEKQIVQTSRISNLDIILTGPKPPNPSELLLTERIDELFVFLKDNYEYIILDSPPLGLISDPLILAKYSDTVIYIVRQNFTRRLHLDALNKLHSEGRIKNVGVIRKKKKKKE